MTTILQKVRYVENVNYFSYVIASICFRFSQQSPTITNNHRQSPTPSYSSAHSTHIEEYVVHQLNTS